MTKTTFGDEPTRGKGLSGKGELRNSMNNRCVLVNIKRIESSV